MFSANIMQPAMGEDYGNEDGYNALGPGENGEAQPGMVIRFSGDFHIPRGAYVRRGDICYSILQIFTIKGVN